MSSNISLNDFSHLKLCGNQKGTNVGTCNLEPRFHKFCLFKVYETFEDMTYQQLKIISENNNIF